jgi:hypothetical protein
MCNLISKITTAKRTGGMAQSCRAPALSSNPSTARGKKKAVDLTVSQMLSYGKIKSILIACGDYIKTILTADSRTSESQGGRISKILRGAILPLNVGCNL